MFSVLPFTHPDTLAEHVPPTSPDPRVAFQQAAMTILEVCVEHIRPAKAR